MITAFAGSKAAEGFYYNVDWRWGFGCFAIIVPVVSLPLFITLKLNLRRAEEQGRIVKERGGRTVLQSIWKGFKDFDGKQMSQLLDKLNGMLIAISINSTRGNLIGWRPHSFPPAIYARYFCT